MAGTITSRHLEGAVKKKDVYGKFSYAIGLASFFVVVVIAIVVTDASWAEHHSDKTDYGGKDTQQRPLASPVHSRKCGGSYGVNYQRLFERKLRKRKRGAAGAERLYKT